MAHGNAMSGKAVTDTQEDVWRSHILPVAARGSLALRSSGKNWVRTGQMDHTEWARHKKTTASRLPCNQNGIMTVQIDEPARLTARWTCG